MSTIIYLYVSFLFVITFYNTEMQDIRKIIGNKIKVVRKNRKMTQYELAEKVGVDPKYISRIETGISYPSLSVVERIFDVLKINISQLEKNDNFNDKKTLVDEISKKLQKTSVKNVRVIKNIVDLLADSNN